MIDPNIRSILGGPIDYASVDLGSELVAVADKLKAVAFLDMPLEVSGSPVTSTDHMITYRENFGSARAYLLSNHTLDGVNVIPGSMLAAGLTAKIDKTRGFWWSPSNQEILGVTGVKWAHDYIIGDPDSQANLLNENEVATIIREKGFRLWGNRTLSADPLWMFLNMRRTADMIEESLLYAHLWAVDSNITRAYIEFVLEGVRDYLRHL